MSDHTNMDLRRPSNPNGPQLEFSLPLNEVDEDLEVGQHGSVSIPVEVTEISQTHVSFRKCGRAESMGAFREESLEAMESRINEEDDADEKEDE